MYLDDQAAAVVAAQVPKAEKIRRLKRLGMRQAEIARALGISDQFVSNVVNRAMRTASSTATTDASTSEPRAHPRGLPAVRVQVGEAGRIVIPSVFRAALEIEPGDEVLLRIEGGEIRVTTPRQALRRAQDLVRQHVTQDRSLADELLAERRRDAARE